MARVAFTSQTAMVTMTLDDSGVVLVVEHNPDERHTAQSMESDVAAFRSLTNGQVLPAIWDVRKMKRPSPEAWQALMHELPDVLAALAMLVDGKSRVIAGAFPAAMNSFLFPARVFEDPEKARDWLDQFVPRDFSLAHLTAD
jgi:hypothetical protein